MRTIWMDRFITTFWIWLVSLAIPIISLLATGGDDDFLIVIAVMAFIPLILMYLMFYMLCVDIIDKKGYTTYEIPLLRITFVFGPFIFFYILTLPSKKQSYLSNDASYLNQNKSNVCKGCGHENRPDAKFCKQCGAVLSKAAQTIKPDVAVKKTCPKCGYDNYSKGNFCKKCGAIIESSENSNTQTFWRCPKCGKENPSSSRICKDCEYMK